ncbi:MAG: hypothetical protein WCJ93_00975 [Methanomicrobiales archaeon]
MFGITPNFPIGVIEYGQIRDLGILAESLMINNYGAPEAGVMCGSDSPDADGANLTRSAYCEYASM